MLKDIFALWQSKSDLMKLQYAYIVVVLLTLVAGGLVGLLNQNVAWQILSVTWIIFIAFCVNVVAFALVNLATQQQPPRPARRPQPRKRS